MQPDNAAILKQIDRVLGFYNALQTKSKYSDLSDLPDSDTMELMQLAISALGRLSPPGSDYLKNAENRRAKAARHIALPDIIGILRALRRDYADGAIQTVAELIHADIFADFLEMAEYLHQQGYKDAGAVIAGSVLEEHLRKLCLKHSIAVTQPNGSHKKADAMNADLASVSVYSKLDQKHITAWLDLRNKSAHGKYGEYTSEQVENYIQGISEFLARHSA